MDCLFTPGTVLSISLDSPCRHRLANPIAGCQNCTSMTEIAKLYIPQEDPPLYHPCQMRSRSLLDRKESPKRWIQRTMDRRVPLKVESSIAKISPSPKQEFSWYLPQDFIIALDHKPVKTIFQCQKNPQNISQQY